MKDGEKIIELQEKFGLTEVEARFIFMRFDPSYEPVKKEQTAKRKNEVAANDSKVDSEFVDKMIDGDENIAAAVDWFLQLRIGDIEHEAIESTQIFLDQMNRKLRDEFPEFEDADDEIRAYEVKMKCNSKIFELIQSLRDLMKSMDIDWMGARIVLQQKKRKRLSVENMARDSRHETEGKE